MNFVNVSEYEGFLIVGIYGLGDVTTASAESLDPDQNIARLNRQLELTRLLIQKVITPILVIFGVIGNVVNIAVLTRRWMKSSTNHYLTALAVYDVLYLLLVFILSFNHYDNIKNTYWYKRMRLPMVRPLTDTCSNTGVWLTLTFTVERYIGVCHPMKGKMWCTPRKARMVIVVVCLSAALVTFPEFFEWTTTHLTDPSTNQTKLQVIPTDFGQSQGYVVGYKYINQALFTFLPLILLSIFNAFLINAVIAAARWRKGVGASEKCERRDKQPQTQQRITVMLIIVVVVFLLCQTPQAFQHVYQTYLEMTGQLDTEKRTIFTITANIFNLLVISNCCSNFILYSSFSSKFRMTFHKLFCGPCTTRRKRATMEQLYSDAAVTTMPSTPRKDGRVDTIVCTELWPSDHANGQTSAANQVATRVAIQMANEMASLSGEGEGGGGRGGRGGGGSAVDKTRRYKDARQQSPTYV